MNDNERLRIVVLDEFQLYLNKIFIIDTPAKILLEAMAYSSLGKGKRLRPLLLYAAGMLNNANKQTLIKLGCAVELIHCFSLIHDDLPSMDNDDLRRGQATCHVKYGEGTAILAGDALQSLAFEIISNEDSNLLPKIQLQIINLLAKSTGVSGMAGGQSIDLMQTGTQTLNLDALMEMHSLKTGKIINNAILSGYLCGVNIIDTTYLKLSDVADKIGLLFQIVDDIIDVTSDTATLGKTARKDVTHNKVTYVNLLGLDKACEYAGNLYEIVQEDLREFDNVSFLSYLVSLIYNRAS